MRASTALLATTYLTHPKALNFPVHSLSPAFLREMLGSPTESPTRGDHQQPILDWTKDWLKEKWEVLETMGESAGQEIGKKIAAYTDKPKHAPTTAPATTAAATTASDTPPPLEQFSTKESLRTTIPPKTFQGTIRAESDAALEAFSKLYRGWEHTMPSWDSVLSKLRCNKIHSFSSCAQHCFTLIPDYGNGERPNDISPSLIPRAEGGSAWWLSTNSNPKKTKFSPSQTFGMALADVRDFKACLYNVCIGDYITNEQTPGCIGPNGDIAVETGNKRGPKDPELDELDFYHPEKAELYKRFGIFTFSKFLQTIIPQCDLSSPNGCRLEPGSLFNLAFFIVMFGAPAIFLLTLNQLVTPLVCPNPGEASGRGPLVDRHTWRSRAFKILGNANRWLAKQERLFGQLWGYLHNATDRQASAHDGYELMVRNSAVTLDR